jgi:MoaA/NifB/PqqE/SkfB family radical SAM enzyme
MRHNWDLVSSDEFFDFWFQQQGATYGWIFQYMPIGRGGSFEMMVTPEQRMEMLLRMWKAVREYHQQMIEYGKQFNAVSSDLWNNFYLADQKKN